MGADPEALLAELLGRATGVNGGRAGSMNVVDPEHGVIGCYGIVGGASPRRPARRLRCATRARVAVAYFGDGATNQAYFFECLNFAKVLELPVVFVCENNGYGEYTPMEAVTPGGIQPRAAAMELPTDGVDGMDVWAVRAAAREAVGRVRAGGGPEFVEAITYRFVGHSRSDPGQVPARGRARALARARPAAIAAGAASARSTGWPPTRSTRSTARSRSSSPRSSSPRSPRRSREPSEGTEFAVARG